MFHSNHTQTKNDDYSVLSNDSSSLKSLWHKLSHLLHSRTSSEDGYSSRSSSRSSSSSSSSRSSRSSNDNRRYSSMSAENNISSSMHKERLFFRSSSDSNCHKKRNYKKKLLVTDNHPQQLIIPPFSPTYCRPNEFPYSNFYVKLPNGKWMVRYRSGNRDILGTDEFEGYMI